MAVAMLLHLHRFPFLLATALMLVSCQRRSVPIFSNDPAPAALTGSTSTSVVKDHLPATVVSTDDGDTLRLQPDNAAAPITVRLGCIDSPETSQAGGEWSADQLAQLLPTGSPVKITPLDTDRYGRTVAELWQSDRSINLELVKLGAAVAYPQYLDQCADPAGIEAAQAAAQSQRLGFWSLPSEQQIMPWDWRNQSGNR